MVGRLPARHLLGAWSDPVATNRYLQYLAEKFAQFTDRVGDNLPRDRCVFYERLLSAAPRLLERDHTRRNLTIVHGDLHVLNSFLPRDGGDDVRFLDWDSWHIGAGSTDLAYMMAVHWYPDRRARLGRPCWTVTTRHWPRMALMATTAMR